MLVTGFQFKHNSDDIVHRCVYRANSTCSTSIFVVEKLFPVIPLFSEKFFFIIRSFQQARLYLFRIGKFLATAVHGDI